MANPSSWDGTRFTHTHGTVTDPTGGATIDVEGRAQLILGLTAMRSAGLITGGTAMKGPLVPDHAKGCYVHGAAVADPTGGTADAESRTAVNAVLAALRSDNIIASAAAMASPAVWDEDAMCQVVRAFQANPTGGATVDAELRTAVGQAMTALRSANVMAAD
jgi:hypothetical protein